MLIKLRNHFDLKAFEITPKTVFHQRRRFLKAAVVAGGALIGAMAPVHARGINFAGVAKSKWSEAALSEHDQITTYDIATEYNNFYEFGTDKGDPARYAGRLKTKPWTVNIDGLVENPGTYSFQDLVRPHQLEERVYRFRCVEGWSMVIPWVGIPLTDVIKRLGPTGSAKYVAFETLLDPKQMPGQRRRVLDWPYREGLRLDEAMHPLTLLAVGLYGEELPNQNGAPIRLVVPWKYGFKSIKSIVRITFTDTQPPTSWNMSAPNEYGFYSNVNPLVDHPRWSQAWERRLGGETNIFGFVPKRPTLFLNGYEEEVAALYAGMNLAKDY